MLSLGSAGNSCENVRSRKVYCVGLVLMTAGLLLVSSGVLLRESGDGVWGYACSKAVAIGMGIGTCIGIDDSGPAAW